MEKNCSNRKEQGDLNCLQKTAVRRYGNIQNPKYLERHYLKSGRGLEAKDTWRHSKVSEDVNKAKGRGAHFNHQGCWGQSVAARNATAGCSIASGPGADANIV